MAISITAIFKSKPGLSIELKKLFEPLVAATRQEKACIQYDLHQSTDDENNLIMIEQWADEQGFEQHLQASHFISFAAQVQSLLAEPLTIYKSVKIM